MDTVTPECGMTMATRCCLTQIYHQASASQRYRRDTLSASAPSCLLSSIVRYLSFVLSLSWTSSKGCSRWRARIALGLKGLLMGPSITGANIAMLNIKCA